MEADGSIHLVCYGFYALRPMDFVLAFRTSIFIECLKILAAIPICSFTCLSKSYMLGGRAVWLLPPNSAV